MNTTSLIRSLQKRRPQVLPIVLLGAVLATWPVLTPTAFAEHKKQDQELTHALTPTAFIYQGQLKESGAPASGSVDFQFTLYTAQTGGDELSSTVMEDIALTDGLFKVKLDFGRAPSNKCWVEMAVRPSGSINAYTVLSPRQKLTPTPYAIFAQQGPWSVIGVPVGFPSHVEEIKSLEAVKEEKTLATESTMAAGPLLTFNYLVKTDQFARPTLDSIIFDNGTNVGVGTASPSAKLEVAGQLKITGGSPGANKVLTSDASGLASWTALSGGVPGSGTLNRVAKWTPNGAMIGNSQIFDDGSRVGIGTASPGVDLDVLGSHVSGLGMARLKSTNAAFLVLDSPTSDAGLRLQTNADDRWLLGIRATNKFKISNASDTNVVTIEQGGDVGIGTDNPLAKLHILSGGDVNAPQVRISQTTNDDFARVRLKSPGLEAWDIAVGRDHMNFFVFNPNTNVMSLTKSGNVGIGTTAPGFKLDVAGVIRADNVSPSDARLKTNVASLSNVLERLEQIRGVSFEWNEQSESLGHTRGQRDIGVIAQEVEAMFPELVHTSSTDGYKAVDYSRLTPVLIEAIKELKGENDALKKRIEALEKAKE